nr:HIT domain-containing protein [Desulfobulbaceae bacterium]
MKTLWAPWRISYILDQEKTKQGCIFDFAAAVSSSKKDLLLYRDSTAQALLNRFPYANGHLLVAPNRHVADLTDLTPAEHSAIMSLITKGCSILRQHLKPDGFNIGLNLGKTAGAGIAEHLHFHIVPRWEDDHNFITVTADIRTIPQHIDETFDLLFPSFSSIAPAAT